MSQHKGFMAILLSLALVVVGCGRRPDASVKVTAEETSWIKKQSPTPPQAPSPSIVQPKALEPKRQPAKPDRDRGKEQTGASPLTTTLPAEKPSKEPEANDEPVSLTDDEKCALVLVRQDAAANAAVSETSVKMYAKALRQLSAIYNVDVEGIASMTLRAHDMLAEKNLEGDCYQLMTGMRLVNAAGGVTYAEAIASYLILRVQGQEDHDKAIGGLTAMLEAVEALNNKER